MKERQATAARPGQTDGTFRFGLVTKSTASTLVLLHPPMPNDVQYRIEKQQRSEETDTVLDRSTRLSERIRTCRGAKCPGQ